MNEDTNESIQVVLQILKKTLIDHGVSIALADDKIMFFDTDTYIRERRFNGFSVNIHDLVK